MSNNDIHEKRFNGQKTSSRLYSVLQLSPRKKLMQKSNVEHGSLIIISLAGNERDANMNKAYKTTRIEGADFNTTFLVVKYFIGALATCGFMMHIPL